MKFNQTLVAIPVLVASTALSASAQTTKHFAISAGWTYEAGPSLQPVIGTSGYQFAGSWFFTNPISRYLPGFETSLDLTYGQISRTPSHLDQYSAQIGVRKFLGAADPSGFHPYFGLGVGVVRNVSQVTTAGQSGGTITVSPSAYMLSAKALLGANITDTLFVEAAYNFNSTVAGYRADTLTVSLGIRF